MATRHAAFSSAANGNALPLSFVTLSCVTTDRIPAGLYGFSEGCPEALWEMWEIAIEADKPEIVNTWSQKEFLECIHHHR